MGFASLQGGCFNPLTHAKGMERGPASYVNGPHTPVPPGNATPGARVLLLESLTSLPVVKVAISSSLCSPTLASSSASISSSLLS